MRAVYPESRTGSRFGYSGRVPIPADITRRYEITSVLGQGGFGTVYRATLKGASGFTKDVAIKLLKDPSPPPEVLERFRDEARVLGLIRDRAVVHVEPPVKLADRWAVVMEYVDGASLSRILRSGGACPPEIALEVTAEIARALHRLWNQAGPDGTPLHLRHRDLKPGNIQIRPDGTVVLLDFGIAKATFESREARTATGVVGTEGYIAPERFFGNEGPTTDVFSLGVVLHEMLTGKRPTPGSPAPAITGLQHDAVALTYRMCAFDPGQRPEPREVERVCTELLRVAGKHGGLREWAEHAVPAASRLEPDGLVGEVLTEASTMQVPSSGRSVGLALFAGGTTALLAIATLGTVLVALLTLLVTAAVLTVRTAPPPPVVVAAPAPPSTSPGPAPVSTEAPAPVAPDPVAPTPVAPPVAPVAPVAPAAVAPVSPPPAPVAASPAPLPVGPTVPVTFGSVPPDADVRVDGTAIGTTPVVGHPLSQGTHTVTLTLDGRSVTKSIVVDRRAPTRYIWRVDTGAWDSSR